MAVHPSNARQQMTALVPAISFNVSMVPKAMTCVIAAAQTTEAVPLAAAQRKEGTNETIVGILNAIVIKGPTTLPRI